MKVKFLRDKAKDLFYEGATLTRQTEGSAGYDIASCMDVKILPNEVLMLPTGFAIEIGDGCFGAIYPRSSMATQRGLVLANTVGIIDSDYRDEVMVAVKNTSDKLQVIRDGERFCQLIIQPYGVSFEDDHFKVKEVDELDDTDRDGGFGSTGA